MKRKEFIAGGLSAFAIGMTGKMFGADALSNRVRLAVMGCHPKGRGFAVMQRAALTAGCEIAVVCDVDALAREAAAAKIQELTGKKPDMAKDVREVVLRADVDGLICCAPDHWHATATIRDVKVENVERPKPRRVRCVVGNPYEATGNRIIAARRKAGETMTGEKTMAVQLKQIETCLTNIFAQVEKPDIILFSECLAQQGAPDPASVAEPVPGGPSWKLAEKVSTIPPSHTNGLWTSSEGIPYFWVQGDGNQRADIRNVVFRNIRISFERGIYCHWEVNTGAGKARLIHPDIRPADYPVTQIVLENVRADQECAIVTGWGGCDVTMRNCEARRLFADVGHWPGSGYETKRRFTLENCAIAEGDGKQCDFKVDGTSVEIIMKGSKPSRQVKTTGTAAVTVMTEN